MPFPVPIEVELDEARSIARNPGSFGPKTREAARKALLHFYLGGTSFRHQQALAAASAITAYEQEQDR